MTRKEGSEEYTLEELVRLMERFKHMVNDAELMRDSLEWDGQSELDPVARYLTPERKVDMEEQMRREQEEKEREAREYLEAHVDSLFGGDGMGSAQMVERNEETRAARERYAGTEAAKAVEKVVTSLRGKVKDAVTRAELEERVPEEDRKGLISQEEELIMPANERVIDAVKAATGRDVTGYYHAVSEDRLWHAILHHGQDSTSTQHVGQLDLTWDDFALLPDILDTGTPEVKSYPKSDTIIEYTKDYNGVVYKVRQRVGRKRRFHESKLSFVTEWIEKRRGSQGVSPDHVQGHSLGFPRDAIQSQGSEDVKGDVSMSVRQARERGLMKDGVMELGNGVLVDGRSDDFSASVRGAQSASPNLYREPDLDYVGAGEGNQAQGWGLYWSTRWSTNRFYHNRFSTAGDPIKPGSKEERLIRLLAPALYVKKLDMEELDYLADDLEGDSSTPDRLTNVLKDRGFNEEDLAFFHEAIANMTIDIARRGLLIFDDLAPVADIKTRIDGEDISFRFNPDGGEFAVNYLADLDVDDSNVLHWDEPASRLFDEHPSIRHDYMMQGCDYYGNEKGKDIYYRLEKKLGSDKAASQWLDARGIRGNKYLDGMSRRHESDEKMYNYVIFNEDYVKITRINNRHQWSEYSEDNPDWQRPDDVSFSVIGESAVTWGRYKDRAFAGRDDGRMRAEIDASRARLTGALGEVKKAAIERVRERAERDKNWHSWMSRGAVADELENDPGASMPLREALEYAELYEAYPELGDMRVSLRLPEDRPEAGAWYDPDRREIFLNVERTEKQWREKLLHELQHAIQEIEGFARGASPEAAGSMEDYRRYAGEVEARNVQRRADFSPWMRENLPFNATLDPGEAIVDFSGAMRRARELELTRRVHELLLGRREEREAKAMVEAWDAWMERFKAVMAGKEGERSRLGRGMEAMARMVALLESTRAALPGRYRVGWLDVQLRWATWYAQMMESGEVTLSEELKDDRRYAAWAARFRDEAEFVYAYKQRALVAEYLLENDIFVTEGIKYPVNYRMRADVDDGNLLHWDEDGADFWKAHPDVAKEFGRLLGTLAPYGKSIYEQLVKKLGSARAASEWLDERWIRGIKYPDAATRNKEGVRTYNYVIFNPDYIEVIAINNRHP